MKKGTMKFYLNAVTTTLPTGNNLMQWGKSSSDQCKLCKGRETTSPIFDPFNPSVLMHNDWFILDMNKQEPAQAAKELKITRD